MTGPSHPADIAAWRRNTRTRLIAERVRLPLEEHAAASARVEARLDEFLQGLPPQVIGAYWPYMGEIDLRPLMERLRERGWTIALPAVVGPWQPLEYRRWNAASEMDISTYGIAIPHERDLELPGIVLAPLVGFDAANYRLGYGAGYFDITLAALPSRPQTLGVGFEWSRLATIYPLATDIAMDIIVTDAGL